VAHHGTPSRQGEAVRLRNIYAFAYALGLRSLDVAHLKDAMRLLLEPCNYWRNVEVPAVLTEIQTRPGERVLDVGSPKLPSLYLCYRSRAEVFATDLFPYFLDEYSHYARRLGQPPAGAAYTMEVQDARRLGYPDNHFDKIYAISVVEHIEEDGDSQAMREFARVLKPGGLCCLTVPFDTRYRETSITHEIYFKKPQDGQPVFYQRHYDPPSLRARLIEPSGMSVLTEKYFCERWFPFEKLYVSLHPLLRAPFSVLGPVFSRLFLRPCNLPSAAPVKAALLTLQKG